MTHRFFFVSIFFCLAFGAGQVYAGMAHAPGEVRDTSDASEGDSESEEHEPEAGSDAPKEEGPSSGEDSDDSGESKGSEGDEASDTKSEDEPSSLEEESSGNGTDSDAEDSDAGAVDTSSADVTSNSAPASEPVPPDSEASKASGSDGDSEEILIIEEDEDEDSIIIMDDGNDADFGSVGIEAPRSNTRVRADYSGRVLLDTVFDPNGEDVVEWWNKAGLVLDHTLSSNVRAFLEARILWGMTGENVAYGERFWGFNPQDTKWTGNTQLREGYMSFKSGDWDIKIGQRVFVWGKNEFQAAADIINPQDLRYDLVGSLKSPRNGKVPVVAADISYWLGDTRLQMVLMPFFQRSSGYIFGRDFALAAPGSQLESQLRQITPLHPSIEDQLQMSLNGTEVPEESLENMSVALRTTSTFWGWNWGATAYYGWEKLPDLYIDPDLQQLLFSGQLDPLNPQAGLTNPANNGAFLDVQQKAAVGQELLRADYHRYWLFAVEGEGVIGDFVVRFDAGLAPSQTHYLDNFDTVQLMTTTAALGLEYTYGDTFFLQLTGFGMGVYDAPVGQSITLLDATYSPSEDINLAYMYGANIVGRYTFEEPRLEISAATLYTVTGEDAVITLSSRYLDFEPHAVELGWAYFKGPTGSLANQYQANDFAYLEYSVTW